MAQADLDAIKAESEARLVDLGVEINKNLPRIEELDEVQPQSARNVAGRACALGYVIGMGYDADQNDLRDHLNRYGLDEWITRRERELLESPSIGEQDKINFTWLTECVQALGWALGLVELDPKRRCDDDLASNFPPRADPHSFIEGARLRPIAKIQKEVDFHYRLHWWVRDCQLKGLESNIEGSVVLERRRALEWLYGVDPDWDEISLDT